MKNTPPVHPKRLSVTAHAGLGVACSIIAVLIVFQFTEHPILLLGVAFGVRYLYRAIVPAACIIEGCPGRAYCKGGFPVSYECDTCGDINHTTIRW